MMPSKTQVTIIIIILCALFASCCSSSSAEPPVQCETEEDLDHTTCNLDDLSDQALIEMCNQVGIDILYQDFYGPYLYTPRYTHDELVEEASECLKEVEKEKNAKKAIYLAENITKMAFRNIIYSMRRAFDVVDDPQDRRVFIEYVLSSLDDKSRSLGYKILLGKDYVDDDEKSIDDDISIVGALSTAIEIHGHYADRVEEIQQTLEDVLYFVHEYNTKDGRYELLHELLSPDNADDDEHREFIRMIIRATNGKKPNRHTVVSFLLSRENINEEERPMLYATLMKFAEEYERMYYEDEEQCIDICCIDDDQQQEVDILVEKEATPASHLGKVGLCILLLLMYLAWCNVVHFTYYLETRESATDFEKWIGSILCFVFGITIGFVYALLRMPIDRYNAQIINKTIYVWSSHAKKLSGKHGRKKKDLINKTGLKEMTVGTVAEDITVEKTVIGNHVPVHLTGNRQAVRKAIEMIQEVIGVQNVIEKFSKPSQAQAPPEEEVDEPDPKPLQDVNDSSEAEQENPSSSHFSLDQNADTHTDIDGSTDITMTNEQQPMVNENDNDQCKKASSEPSTPATVIASEAEEELSFEVGINSSQEVTPETNDEVSTSSHSGIRSTISNADSHVSSVENDSLLLFLQSQHESIKGSVDEFYKWLKSEDIDSMVALQEAVCDEDYLNNTMKVGNGTSGLKGFKRKVFQRAVKEYADATTNSGHSLSQNAAAFIPSNLFSDDEQKPSSLDNDPPEELVCPISLVLMTNDPVVAADGITYERSPIEDWFQKSNAKIRIAQENLKHNPNSESDQRVVIDGICSPVHGTRLVNLSLVSNIGIRNMARACKERKTTRAIGPPPGF